MSQAFNTPEFHLARTDSKNAATTCQGLTANGQRCRRTVVSATQRQQQQFALLNYQKAADGVAALFCWQHKNQAAQQPAKSRTATCVPVVRERSSIETLVERVGLMTVGTQPVRESKKPSRDDRERKESRPLVGAYPPPTRHVQPGTLVHEAPRRQRPLAESADGRRRRSSSGRKLVCFVMQVDDDNDTPASKIRPSSSHHSSGKSSYRASIPFTRPSTAPRIATSQSSHSMTPQRPRCDIPALDNQPQLRPPVKQHRHHHSLPTNSLSQTQSLLSWIPPTLSPKTTSKLLQKLSEPLSKDEESGYIYLCWVTPIADSPSPPAPEFASALIPPPREREDLSKAHRTSDVIRSAGLFPRKAVHNSPPSSRHGTHEQSRPEKTIILKIGRTTNVHARLNQWSQQCAHNLTLMRYYPYTPSTIGSTTTALHPASPNKIPITHRVESLVLTELADLTVPVNETCSSCGKKHKEWFEVRAEKEQLRAVDECVRRWVRWSLEAV